MGVTSVKSELQWASASTEARKVAAGGAQSGAEVAKAKGCMGCHDVSFKKAGPAFKDVAAKYKDNKEAEAKIMAELKEGKGHPVKIAATDAELRSLA